MTNQESDNSSTSSQAAKTMQRESTMVGESLDDDWSTDLPSEEIELRIKSNWNMNSSSDDKGFQIRNSLVNPVRGTKRGGKKRSN
eukprot:scaffold6604_cov186-Amphora_coffeaeformis.AAC.1